MVQSKQDKQAKLRSLIDRAVYIGVAVVIGVIIFAVAAPNYVNPSPDGKRKTNPSYACINNLRRIDGAKRQWLIEMHAPSNAVPTWEDINLYLGFGGKQADIPKCLAGGVYSIGAISNAPTCTVKGHQLN